ncbi:MAG: FAD-binding oxidoreductase, partial [Sneathiella sp.]|uniref:FAD-binding protein n=1 Tax=Sneathiella sp. TaxID=1964365 RepID=UPI000C3EAA1A|nr:FAD-binding oxidoreductase [Sneathiella sp.]
MLMPKPNADVLAKRDALVAGLRRIIPDPEGVIDDKNDLRAFECDGLSAYRQLPMIAVLPSTVAEIAETLKYCQTEGVNVVPRGAGTSLSGGALPLA